jgi:hypothetical protein
MGHFAKVKDGKVIEVIVAEPEFFESFVDSTPGQWLQTSYNTFGGVHYDPITKQPSLDQSKALRKNFAGIEFDYDSAKDAFIPPKLYNSWKLNEQTCLWEPPIAYPNDGDLYEWDETSVQWLKQKEKTEFCEITIG